MSDIKQIETRLEDLVRAHRGLAARNEALFQTCKIMFALTPAPLPMVQYLLKSLHQATKDHMDSGLLDEEYQSLVEEAMEELQSVALAGRQ